MIEINKCAKLIDSGFSLITATATKKPNIQNWQYPNSPLTKKEFKKNYDRSDTEVIGIACGHNDVHCLDVDLKVLKTAQEQVDWWNEYYSFLKDNIYEFDEKFVIYKTKNAGYHILYKSKSKDGNTKLAKLKDHKEQILETRGVGGYFALYDNPNNKSRNYLDIDYISDEDRQILMALSKSYNYQEPIAEVIPAKVRKEFNGSRLSCWDDYNNKHNVWELIAPTFDYIKEQKDRLVVRRKGASSEHSGYIYKDTGLLYLFSSGTSFNQQKGYSPFAVYAHLNHRDDFTSASKDLYAKGYGERIVKTPKFDNIYDDKNEVIEIKDEIKEVIFPLEIFPEMVQKYILQCNLTLNASVDYMGSAMLFVTSVIIGNSHRVEVTTGWSDAANVWLSLVGEAGIGKTHSISLITDPLEKANTREIKKYIKLDREWDQYSALDKKEQALVPEVRKPSKSQFIANDITLEALLELHDENPNGVGILKDELAGFFKSMNQYREGGDKEHWLSSWSNKSINLNRKTAKSAFVERAYMPILGGIQPSIMDQFQTEENMENGFLDRVLFCYPELKVQYMSDKVMKPEQMQWFSDYIIKFYDDTKKTIKYSNEGEIVPVIAKYTKEADIERKRIDRETVDLQNSDNLSAYMKSMLPKQKNYVSRFALLIQALTCLEDPKQSITEITKSSILKAEILSKYFIEMARKIKIKSAERKSLKDMINPGKSNYENFVGIYGLDPDFNRTELSKYLNVTRMTILRWIAKQPKTAKND